MAEALKTLASYTDLEDYSIMSKGRLLDGSEASGVDLLFAGVGSIMPAVSGSALKKMGQAGLELGVEIAQKTAVHGNSLKSLRPTWGYKLYSQDGTFLKNGITSQVIPANRYTRTFMQQHRMEGLEKFSNRKEAYQWESLENQTTPGPWNHNKH